MKPVILVLDGEVDLLQRLEEALYQAVFRHEIHAITLVESVMKIQ